MKAIIFYIVSILTVLLLCSEITLAWFILAIVNVVLAAWCKKHLTLREVVRYTGYDIWYKFLK